MDVSDLPYDSDLSHDWFYGSGWGWASIDRDTG